MPESKPATENTKNLTKYLHYSYVHDNSQIHITDSPITRQFIKHALAFTSSLQDSLLKPVTHKNSSLVVYNKDRVLAF